MDKCQVATTSIVSKPLDICVQTRAMTAQRDQELLEAEQEQWDYKHLQDMPLRDCDDITNFLPSQTNGTQTRLPHSKESRRPKFRDTISHKERQKQRQHSKSPITPRKPLPLDARLNKHIVQEEEEQLWKDSSLGMFSKHEIIHAQARDQFCCDMIEYLSHGHLPPTSRRAQKITKRENDHMIIEGILYNVWVPYAKKLDEICVRLVVPTSLQSTVLHNMHKSQIAAHTGIFKMIASMKTRFSWNHMLADIQRYVSSCVECNKAKGGIRQDPPRTLYDLVQSPMVRISIDFTGPFAATTQSQNRFICVVTDHFSGYTIAWPMRHTKTSEVAKQLYERVFCVFGTPTAIVSDNGPQFVSNLYDELCKLMKIRKLLSSFFRPTTNGSVEVRNRSIKELLKTLCSDKPKSWDEYLQSVIFALNSSCHTMSNLTPNVIMFGRDLPNAFDSNTLQNVEVKPVHEFLSSVLEKQRFAYDQAVRLHAKRDIALKKAYDKKRRTLTAHEGDIVFYYKPSLPDPSVNSKLQNHYIGPLIITKLHNNSTASLKCLSTGKFLKRRVNLAALKRPSYYRLMPGTTEHQNASDVIDTIDSELEALDKQGPCRNVDIRPIGIETLPPPDSNGRAIGPLYAPKGPYDTIKIKID